MIEFLRGFQWGLGFWLSVFMVGFGVLIVTAGLIGISNLAKHAPRPPIGPAQ